MTLPDPDPSSPAIDHANGVARLMGDAALFARVLARFRKEYRNTAAVIDGAIKAGNLQLAQRLAHTLKGAAGMIEMVYHLKLNAALGPELKFLGTTLNAQGANSWFGCAFVMATGLALFEVSRRHFVRQWGEIQEFIEKEIKRREAL